MNVDPRCDFCGQGHDKGRKLIAGRHSLICFECVAVCVDIIEDDDRFDAGGGSRSASGPAPLSLRALIDRIAELSGGLCVSDQWLLLRHVLARLRERHHRWQEESQENGVASNRRAGRSSD